MARNAQIERRIAKIKQAPAELGDMRPGSLSTQTRKWGGRYCRLSYTHLGKGRTAHVPQERITNVKQQLANHKRFKELTQEWLTLAIGLCKLKAAKDEQK